MSEKPASDEFEEDDVDELLSGDDDVDLDRVNKDLDLANRHAKTVVDPAWRRLERLAEERHFAELVSDLEDYDVGSEGVVRAKKA